MIPQLKKKVTKKTTEWGGDLEFLLEQAQFPLQAQIRAAIHGELLWAFGKSEKAEAEKGYCNNLFTTNLFIKNYKLFLL